MRVEPRTVFIQTAHCWCEEDLFREDGRSRLWLEVD